MTHPFLQALKKRPLLVDGAMGTLLYARGASAEASFEQMNLTRADIVQQVHIEYINAGAEVIETNSFSGNRMRLSNYGLENDVWKINVAAAKTARNAREVAGHPVFVAGSVGPTGRLLKPVGDVSEREMEGVFIEQMEALLAGGVDLFMIETMSSLDETIAAVRAARKVAKLPVVAQLSFSTEGHSYLGVSPEDTIRLIDTLGSDFPDVIGINCGAGPGPVFDAFIRMTSAFKSVGFDSERLHFSCLPNAGQPSLSGGRYMFMSRPSYCASYVEPFVQAGARLVGGCCGTTPEHIKAMRAALDKYIEATVDDTGEVPESANKPVVVTSGTAAKDRDEDTGTNEPIVVEKAEKCAQPTLAERLQKAKDTKSGEFFISVELDPPKGAIMKKLLQAAEQLHKAGADAINVGDSPMARVRMSSMATCQLINQKVGVETIIHFTTRDRNLMGIQADLLGCQALGIRNVIALTGDPPSLGNYVHATAVYDVDSVGLIKIIKQLNQGKDLAGNSIGTPTNLSIACALNFTVENRKTELNRLRAKLDAGAHFIMTQPIYQIEDLTDFLEEFGDCPVPILAGIMPLNSFKHAEYLHNEVPGISIPEKIRETMQKAGDDGARVGVELAGELLQEVQKICQGTYLVPSFGRYDEMCQLIKIIRKNCREKMPVS
ncbi:MAG TPA: bifunctional homocysteine S-methyltransferase/methylenetetrahydrofolate reductase [Oculatellaceae cyanobacterium]